MMRACWLMAGLVVLASLAELRGQPRDDRRSHGRFTDLVQGPTAGPTGPRPNQPAGMSRANPYPIGYLIGPVVAGPFFGVPVVTVPIWTAPAPILVQPPPIVLVTGHQPGALEGLNGDRLALLPQADANLGLVPRAPALQPAPAKGNAGKPARPGQRAPEKKPAPANAGKLAEPPPLPGPAAPLPAPRKESSRLIQSGREAFATREYARAERRFAEATQVAADQALNYFLLAEAQFAQGKYQEAFSSIQSGLQLEPAWPAASFHPRELYGLNQADRARHLEGLGHALERYPDDLILTFLSAYHLWFDGRREEARPLFLRAAQLAPDLDLSKTFLQPVPYVPLFIR